MSTRTRLKSQASQVTVFFTIHCIIIITTFIAKTSAFSSLFRFSRRPLRDFFQLQFPGFPSMTHHHHSNIISRDGSHNHPTTISKDSAATSTSLHEHTLRDGSHNHPPVNTMDLINSRLSSLNLVLPPPGAPKANYQLIQRDGNMLYLSGHLPMKADGQMITGCCAPSHVIEASGAVVGDSTQKLLTTDQGYEAARHCALNLLSTLQSYLSTHVLTTTNHPADLSYVAKVIKIFGIVRSHPEFTEQHLVMNGASDILGEVLGKEVGGCHARSAIGTNALPLGICVEVEMIVKIKD